MLLNRSENLQPVHSDIRGPLYLESQRMAKEGIPVLRLNTGNPATFGFGMPDSVRNSLLANVDKAVAYCDLKGMPNAREAICNYHKSTGIQDITPDDVYIGNGVSELVLMCLLALLNKGDEVLMPSPSYSLWSNSTYIAGGKPVFYTCDEQNDWYPDIADMRKKVTPKTRAIVIINPNNPTGAVYPKEVLEDIIQVARENDLLIFSDEIYDRLVMDGKKHVSIASLMPDRMCVTFNGLSKSHRIAGYRVGWMVLSGNKKHAQGFITGLNLLSSMRLCSNVPGQSVIQTALGGYQSVDELLLPGGRIYEQREFIYKAINDIPGLSAVKPDAAFYIFPKIDLKKIHIKDDEQMVLDFLKQQKVLMLQGTAMNWDQPDHFRIVYLPDRRTLGKATERLAEFLSTYSQY